MKKGEWFGGDASNRISLLEYGLLIRKIGKDLYDVVYATGYKSEDEANTFSVTTYSEKEAAEVINESWFRKNSFLSFVGETEEEWLRRPLVLKIGDMLSYYGCENIFGTTYHPQTLEEIKKNMKITL